MNKGVQQIFGEVTSTYEIINHVLTFGLDMRWRKRAASLAAEGGGKLWLDVCSGTGETAVYLKRLAQSGTVVVSLDFCEPMLRKAREKPAARGIFFTLADANILPFPDEAFDLITMSFAARNINTNRDTLVKCLKEFYRALKKGGRFINLETSQPDSNILRRSFHACIGLFVQPVGGLISGSRTGYKYLSHTIPRFYDADEFSSIIREAGFAKLEYKRLLAGVAAIHKAIK